MQCVEQCQSTSIGQQYLSELNFCYQHAVYILIGMTVLILVTPFYNFRNTGVKNCRKSCFFPPALADYCATTAQQSGTPFSFRLSNQLSQQQSLKCEQAGKCRGNICNDSLVLLGVLCYTQLS